VVKHAAFAVPGNLDTPTGGYAYDKRIIAELERMGWRIALVDLGEGFPWPSHAARSKARTRLLSVPAGCPIVVDGLALGALPDVASELENPLLALVHHPLALEWGLSSEQADFLRQSERRALACARRVAVTSSATARIVSSDYGVPPERITVARPGNDPVPRARGSRGGVLHLLSVGAVVPRKGFDVLIAALAELTDLEWRLTIAGDLTRDPVAAERLQLDIVRHGLSCVVATPGAVSSEQLGALYDSADLFVLASRFEGYGMAYAEALAHGLPVIGTKVGAIPDTIPHEAGLLVDAGDVAALAGVVRRAIIDPGLRQRLSESALAAARRLPTWAQSAKDFADALEALT
jgi:glycosyltransferase involved in cell wall biosynthesis